MLLRSTTCTVFVASVHCYLDCGNGKSFPLSYFIISRLTYWCILRRHADNHNNGYIYKVRDIKEVEINKKMSIVLSLHCKLCISSWLFFTCRCHSLFMIGGRTKHIRDMFQKLSNASFASIFDTWVRKETPSLSTWPDKLKKEKRRRFMTKEVENKEDMEHIDATEVSDYVPIGPFPYISLHGPWGCI